MQMLGLVQTIMQHKLFPFCQLIPERCVLTTAS